MILQTNFGSVTWMKPKSPMADRIGLDFSMLLGFETPQLQASVISRGTKHRSVPRMPTDAIDVSMIGFHSGIQAKLGLIGGGSHNFSIYLNAIVGSARHNASVTCPCRCIMNGVNDACVGTGQLANTLPHPVAVNQSF
jgi:hypothetical protein